MRILNEEGVELQAVNLDLGYLKEDQIFIRHHEAIVGHEEIGHYEVIAEYPNGGQDVEWIIDVPYMSPQEAWDEYETIQRYILYPVVEQGGTLENEENTKIEEDLEIMAIDHEYRLTLLELGITE